MVEIIDLRQKPKKKSFLKFAGKKIKEEFEKTRTSPLLPILTKGKIKKSYKVPAAAKIAAGAAVAAGAINPAATALVVKKAAKTAVKAIPKTPLGAVKAVAGAGLVAGIGGKGLVDIGKSIYGKGKTGGEILSGKKDIGDVIGKDKGLGIGEAVAAGLGAAGIIGAVAALSKAIKKRKADKTEVLLPASQSPQIQPVLVEGGLSPAPGFEAAAEPAAAPAQPQTPVFVNVIQNQITR